MNSELGRVCPVVSFDTRICLVGLRKIMNVSNTVFGVLAEFRTRNLPNTKLKF
jgi:hypothetical protein